MRKNGCWPGLIPAPCLSSCTSEEAHQAVPGSTGQTTRNRVSIHAAATAFGLAFLLAGCQTPTVVRDRVVEVVKPVATQPVRPDQVPAVPAPLGPRPQAVSAAADTLLAKWCDAVSYFLRADPLLRVSSGQPQKELPRYPECEGR